MTAIRLDRVSKDFGGHRVLHEVDLEVAEGEFVVLLGASGSGKSTTLRLVSGLERVNTGTIFFGDRVMSSPRATVPPNRRSLGFVFQSYALWPHLSVRQNVEYPLRARKLRLAKGVREEAMRALDLVRMAPFAERRISQLSGGQQQRVALARAIVGAPGLLLFDEPLSNLDTGLRTELRNEIGRLHRELGFTGLYVTHDYSEAMFLADRIAIFESGTISQIGATREVFSKPSTESIARFLGFENLLPATVVRNAGTTLHQVVTADDRSVVVAGAGDLGPHDPVLLAGHPRDVVLHPVRTGTGEAAMPTAGGTGPISRFHDVAISDLTGTSAGYTARFALSGARLSGVLPSTEWGADPRVLLDSGGWRADVTIDWSQVHAIPNTATHAQRLPVDDEQRTLP